MSKSTQPNPNRVASISLICSAGLGESINSDYIDGFVSSANRKELKPKLKHLFADDSLVNRSMVDDLLKYKRLDGVQTFLDGLKENLFSNGKQNVNIAAGLDALDCPQQVIWGEADAVIPKIHANRIAAATVSVISGAGHMVQMEESSQVNDEGWNFGPDNNSNLQVGDIVQLSHKYWSDIQIRINKNIEEHHEANLLMLDCAKANKKLKWNSVWGIDKTINKTISWYKSYYENNQVLSLEDLKDYILDAKSANISWAK